MTKKRALIGTTLVALAAGALALLVPLLRAPAAVSLSSSCVPGEQRVYSVAYSSDGKLLDPVLGLGGDNGTPKPEQRVFAKIDGKLAVACIASNDADHTVSLTFESPSGSLSLPDGTGGDAMPALLAGQTFVTRDARGHTNSIRFSESMPEKGRNIVRDILALAQVTFPEPGGPAQTWSTREEAMSGTFETAYTVEAVHGEQVTLKKTRSPNADTEKLRSEAMRPRAVPKDERPSEFRVNRIEHALEAADVVVALELRVGKRLVGETKGQLVLAQVEKRNLSDSELAARMRELEGVTVAGTPASDLAASDVDARLERRIQETELGSDTWKTLMDRSADKDDTKTYLKMKALFFLQPESCEQARQALAGMDDPNGTRFQQIAGALASAGTPESQAALVAAIRASAGQRAKEHGLIGAAGFVKKPTADTMKALDEIARGKGDDEVRSTARFARGSLAGQRTDTDPAQARAIVKEEVAAYRTATGSDDRTTALLALGNTGAKDVLEVAREALADPDPQVRAAAASSLRSVADGEAEDLLMRVAATDSAGVVRAEAVRSLGLRILSAPAMEIVTQLVKTDGEEDVRMMAVQVLSREVDRDPGLEWVLDDVARNDRARGIRNAAVLVLQRYRATRG